MSPPIQGQLTALAAFADRRVALPAEIVAVLEQVAATRALRQLTLPG